MDFRQTALKNRRLLLLSLSYWERQMGNGAATTVARITEKAIEAGYVEDRKPPLGVTMNTWITTGEVPAWAAKAAANMLLEIPDYRPRTTEESASLALALAEANPGLESSEIIKLIPPALSDESLLTLVEEAVLQRKI